MNLPRRIARPDRTAFRREASSEVSDLGRVPLVDVADDVGGASGALPTKAGADYRLAVRLRMDSRESARANLALAATTIDCIAMGIQTGP